MIRCLSSLLLVVTILMVATPVAAIVDVHDEYYANPDVDTFSVFGFDFHGASGNKEQSAFAVETHTLHRLENKTLMLLAEYNFEETNNVKSEDSKFLHFRFTHQIAGRHGYEIYTQYSEDEFERLERRVLLGVGYRFEWKPGSDTERGLLGIGLLREHERYTNLTVEQRLSRANFYASVSSPMSFAEGASISLSAYAQPALSDFSDIRAIAVLTLKANLSEKIAVKFGVNYKHDSDPETGIDESNISYSSGITYTIK